MLLTRGYEDHAILEDLEKDRIDGSKRVQDLMKTNIPEFRIQRKTLAQVMMDKSGVSDLTKVLVTPNGEEGFNPALPSNLHLVCGDTGIMAMEQSMQHDAQGHVTQLSNPFKETQHKLRDFITRIGLHLSQKRDAPGAARKKVRVFIDTNPALSIFTQMALSAATKLVTPLNADDFSNAAVDQMFDQLYNFGVELEGNALQPWIKDQYSYKMWEYDLPVPPIHAVIHNRDQMYNDTAAKVFQSMHGKTADILYEKLVMARAQDSTAHSTAMIMANRMFNLRGASTRVTSAKHLAVLISGTMRDIKTTGVISTHMGLPLWQLKRNSQNVDKSMAVRVPGDTVLTSCMQDMVGLQPIGDELVELQPIPEDAKTSLMQLLMDDTSSVCAALPRRTSKWIFDHFRQTRATLLTQKFRDTHDGSATIYITPFKACPTMRGCINRLSVDPEVRRNMIEDDQAPKNVTIATRRAVSARLNYQHSIQDDA